MGLACQAMAERELNGPSRPVVRCFVGAAVEPGAAHRLQADFLMRHPDLARRVGGGVVPGNARLVPLPNFHVTIKFVGQVPAADLPDLVDLVAALGATPTRVEVVGYTGLPRPGRAHSGVADLAPHAELADWKRRLELTLGEEDRPYRPHVTVARFRSGAAFAAVRLDQPLVLDLRAPRLFRSDQVPGGVRYTAVTAGRQA
jgi:RNA 2',3'-cyclic 3'-phosphodiesterase